VRAAQRSFRAGWPYLAPDAQSLRLRTAQRSFPLAGLISLQTLDLSGCEQLDLSPLANLTSLKINSYVEGDAPFASPKRIEDPERARLPDDRSISVLYATNRACDVVDSTIDEVPRFSYNRSSNLTYGSAMVRVPESHKLGHVEHPAHWSIWGITMWREEEKDSKHFTLQRVTRLTQEQFTKNIKKNKESSALLFVHGYNTDFTEAIFKLAQNAWDTQYHGIPVAFSWTSKGGIANYDYDRESALFSRVAFLQVLDLLSKHAEVSKIYVVAHSMGNQIVVDALAHAEGLAIPLALSEVVFAAPDVDRDVLEPLIPLLISKAKGITLYASAADKALLASQLKAQGSRAGYISSSGPLILPGMETIDVTAVGEDMFSINHDAYSGVRSVLDDIGRLVISGIHPPNLRSPQIRGAPEGSAQPDYWRYPQ
jgi:esterase/lipase superfamily enzyme